LSTTTDLARYYAAWGSEVSMRGAAVLSGDLVARVTGPSGTPAELLRLRGSDGKLALASGAVLGFPAGSGTLARLEDIPGGGGGGTLSIFGGGTGATDAATALANLGGQPLDSDLTAIAALAAANDDVIQRKAGAWTNRTLAQLLSDLNLGALYQPLDSDLTAIAALTTDSFGRGLLEKTTAADVRTYIGAGTANPTLQDAYDNTAAPSPSDAEDPILVTDSTRGGVYIRRNHGTSASVALGVMDFSLSSSTPTFSVTGAGAVNASAWSGAIIPVRWGGTGIRADLTGGANHVVKQTSLGAVFTTGQLTFGELSGSVGAGQIANNTITTAMLQDDAVSNGKLRNSAALSVIGRNLNSGGDPADIAATAASGAVLRESGSTIGFGTIATAGIADSAVTLAKLANIADATILGNNTGGAAAPVALTATQVRTLLGLTVGTDVQAWDAQLDSLAALSYGSNALKVIRVNAAETAFELAAVGGTLSGLTAGRVLVASGATTATGYADLTFSGSALACLNSTFSMSADQRFYMGGAGSGVNVRQNLSGGMTLASGVTNWWTWASGAFAPASAGGGSIGASSAGVSGVFFDESGAGTETVSVVAPTISGNKTVTLPAETCTLAGSTDKLSFFAATTSAELRGVLSDESGNGAALFQNGDIGAATGTSLNLTLSGTPLTLPTGGVLAVTNAANATDNAILAINSGSGAGAPRLGLYGGGTERARILADSLGNFTIQASPAANTVTFQFGPTADAYTFNDKASNNQLHVNGDSSTLGPPGIDVLRGSLTLAELSSTPTDPTSGVQGRIYVKGDKLVFQFNDAGTVRYKYISLSGTSVTWTHSTTPP
jgi:hypothetical protein